MHRQEAILPAIRDHVARHAWVGIDRVAILPGAPGGRVRHCWERCRYFEEEHEGSNQLRQTADHPCLGRPHTVFGQLASDRRRTCDSDTSEWTLHSGRGLISWNGPRGDQGRLPWFPFSVGLIIGKRAEVRRSGRSFSGALAARRTRVHQDTASLVYEVGAARHAGET